MLETSLKRIVDGSTMTEDAKLALVELLNETARLQRIETAVARMKDRSQQFRWKGFPKPDGRWLLHEANLFPGASNVSASLRAY